MTFGYIAGFFDGEGHVRIQRRISNLQATMVQSTKQDQVLLDIQAFLKDNGIVAHSSVADMKYTAQDGRVCGMRTLSIHDSASLIKFFENTLPYLIVKKEKAAEALQWAREKQARKDIFAAKLVECERLYLAGASMDELFERFGLGNDSFKRHMARRGLPIRDRFQAAQLRWNKYHGIHQPVAEIS